METTICRSCFWSGITSQVRIYRWYLLGAILTLVRIDVPTGKELKKPEEYQQIIRDYFFALTS